MAKKMTKKEALDIILQYVNDKILSGAIEADDELVDAYDKLEYKKV